MANIYFAHALKLQHRFFSFPTTSSSFILSVCGFFRQFWMHYILKCGSQTHFCFLLVISQQEFLPTWVTQTHKHNIPNKRKKKENKNIKLNVMACSWCLLVPCYIVNLCFNSFSFKFCLAKNVQFTRVKYLYAHRERDSRSGKRCQTWSFPRENICELYLCRKLLAVCE